MPLRHHDGQVIALLPENTEKLAQAVEQLRRTAVPRPAPWLGSDRVAGIQRRLVQLTAEISDLARSEPRGQTRMRLGSALLDARDRLERLVLEFGPLV